MGKRPAGVELFEGNMVSMQREIRPSMQRDEPPTMATGLERIAGKARCGPNIRFTSLAHHITPECGGVYVRFLITRRPELMVRRYRRRRRALRDGLAKCSSPSTARGTKHRISGVS